MVPLAILVVSGSAPIITERVEIGVLRTGKIIRFKNTIDEGKGDHFFAIGTFRVARIIFKVRTRRQR